MLETVWVIQSITYPEIVHGIVYRNESEARIAAHMMMEADNFKNVYRVLWLQIEESS